MTFAVARNRTEARTEIAERIKEAARARVAVEGPFALSVRSVARDVGMASSALFRYFPSREDLLSTLADDAGEELDSATRKAVAAAGSNPLEQWFAGCRALRVWAVAHPQEFSLIYTNPRRDQDPQPYAGPAPGTLALLASILAAAQETGRLAPTPEDDLTAELFADASLIRVSALPGVSEPVVVRSVMAVSVIFGLVSFEVFGHLAGSVSSTAQLFERWVSAAAGVAGLAY